MTVKTNLKLRSLFISCHVPGQIDVSGCGRSTEQSSTLPRHVRGQ